ncbi:hypothetical protein P691DRAFT_809959, partial [Macrolepiota fuliginosa MF-IS2]
MAESTTTSTPSQTTASTPTTTAPAPAPAPAVTTTAEPKGLLLKADAIANQFRAEVQSSLGRAERKPKLVGILATSSAPSKSYAEFTRRQCEELGFEFVLRKVGAALNSVGEGGGGGEVLGEGEGVEEAIVEANEDGSVDGIMVSVVCLFWGLGGWLSELCVCRCIFRFLERSRFVFLVL